MSDLSDDLECGCNFLREYTPLRKGVKFKKPALGVTP